MALVSFSNQYISMKAGQSLEVSTALRVKRLCPSAVVLTSVPIETDGKYTTVDLIVIIGHEIYVLEMKNYSVRLNGRLADYYWFGQTARKSHKIVNPFKQNLHHVARLTSSLVAVGVNLQGAKFIDLIIVPDSCELIVDSHVKKFIKSPLELAALICARHSEMREPNRQDIVEVIHSWTKV